MDQQTEKLQDSEKKASHKSWSARKKRAILAVIATAFALLVIPVFAWLYMQRSMETITKVNMPYALLIGAGDAKPIQQLELSNIDVSGAQKYKDVVFCVYSEKPEEKYYLQLAHTTNIGFKYEIYKASRSAADASAGEVVSYLGKQYIKGEQLAGSYLNKDENSDNATDKYHEITYNKYDKEHVQKSAEPLYWKTTSQETLPEKQDDTTYYVNYYILRILWDENVQNNKETDMIYLMAG